MAYRHRKLQYAYNLETNIKQNRRVRRGKSAGTVKTATPIHRCRLYTRGTSS